MDAPRPLRPDPLKVTLLWLFCLAVRFVPLRPANLEPVMAALLPHAARHGAAASFVFAAAIMVVFDVLSGQVGSWTWTTALIYGLVGSGLSLWLRTRPPTVWNFVLGSVAGTLAFDVLTAALGPLQGMQGWAEAYLLQIPFTLRHLAGNVLLAAVVSPLLFKWIVGNRRLCADVVLRRLRRA